MVTEQLRTAIECGTYEIKGQFTFGSNYTFLVAIQHEGSEYPAVYKPLRGEQPLWDFPENTLAGREVAAYLVSEYVGFHFVPFTTLRQDGPFGAGSLQQYIEYDPEYHYFSFSEEDRQLLKPVVLFDVLCNNADRKGSHVFFEDGTHKLYAIDHGICFHEEDKLRTVLWDFSGQKIPQELLTPLAGIKSLFPSLEPYLTRRELAALAARSESILKKGTFPRQPRDRRALPWPPL
ncbi:MAG TPA: SCO1664 family protein [Anaerolineales bacterium]|nr:SCO1664 family protein [Anaerolineales bacterium]